MYANEDLGEYESHFDCEVGYIPYGINVTYGGDSRARNDIDLFMYLRSLYTSGAIEFDVPVVMPQRYAECISFLFIQM